MKCAAIHLTLVASMAIFVTISIPAQTNIGITVPNGWSNGEGNARDATAFTGPARFQQVYRASQFSAMSNGGGLITALFFRIDGFCGSSGFAAVVSNFQINLSTTLRPPDGLSAVFAENPGPDDAVVFGPGLLSVAQLCSTGSLPQVWGVRIDLATPFFYHPARGNLLMDIRNPGASEHVGALDAEFTEGDSISCVLDTVATATTARFVASYGFVTLFGVQPVPSLSISKISTDVMLRWVNQTGGWLLQQSPVLGIGANWQAAGGIVSTNGVYKEVRFPLDPNDSQRFCRLVLPSSPSVVRPASTAASLRE